MRNTARTTLGPLCFLCALGVFVVNGLVIAADPIAPWATYRGNSQRTGNTDNIAGPKTPKVLWALKSQEHFIAAPVPFGERVYIAGLGAFNVSTFHALALDPK